MSRSRRPRLLALVLALTVLAPAASSLAAQDTKYWREDSALTPAPELSRFNQLLADLADQLKPALVHVRVRRAPGKDKDDDSPREPRRSSGSATHARHRGRRAGRRRRCSWHGWRRWRRQRGRHRRRR